MNELIIRIEVLAKSLLGKLSLLLGILVAVAQQLPTLGETPAWVQRDLASLIAVLTVAVVQVRKHTPVSDEQVGLLPPKGPGTPTLDDTGAVHVPDQGSITTHIVLCIIAVVCGVLLVLVGIGAITITGDSVWTIAGIGIICAGLAGVV